MVLATLQGSYVDISTPYCPSFIYTTPRHDRRRSGSILMEFVPFLRSQLYKSVDIVDTDLHEYPWFVRHSHDVMAPAMMLLWPNWSNKTTVFDKKVNIKRRKNLILPLNLLHVSNHFYLWLFQSIHHLTLGEIYVIWIYSLTPRVYSSNNFSYKKIFFWFFLENFFFATPYLGIFFSAFQSS